MRSFCSAFCCFQMEILQHNFFFESLFFLQCFLLFFFLKKYFTVLSLIISFASIKNWLLKTIFSTLIFSPEMRQENEEIFFTQKMIFMLFRDICNFSQYNLPKKSKIGFKRKSRSFESIFCFKRKLDFFSS